VNKVSDKLVDILKSRTARLVLAALLTYGASVATTGKWDPSALLSAVVGAFLPGTTPLQMPTGSGGAE
jgi:hypothetical protein